MKDPFKDFEEMRKRMNRLLGGFEGSSTSSFQRPEIDVMDKDKKITVIAELPGIRKEDIEINAEPHTLEIKAESKKGGTKQDQGYYYRERSSKSYRRHIDLPAEVNPQKAEANYNNGILEIDLPKKHPEQKGTNIPIN